VNLQLTLVDRVDDRDVGAPALTPGTPLGFCLAAGQGQDLHSFPTRRSSDLTRCTSECCAQTAGWSTRTRYLRCGRCARPASRWRSEEHTSELQSRENLVCRLLLEKKKQHDRDEPPARAAAAVSPPGTCRRR